MEAYQEDDYSLIMEESRNMIIKGKRTKRPRPSSPLALTMASTSSTATTASEDGDIENPSNTFFNMPSNSIEFTKIIQDNDEEDMANCLILLAQGQSSSSPPPPHKGVVEGMRTSGFYVYECKTCNRGFSSFQALGGHRASHKKPPKANLEDSIRPNMMMRKDVDGYRSSTTLSLQIGSNQLTQSNPGSSVKVAKIHECSICSAEFASGQALGGHMRRHRSMPMAARTSCGDSSGCQESKKPKTLLSLDLNLPAPSEDDQRETKFPFRAKDQMIVFSSSSLVHCHF